MIYDIKMDREFILIHLCMCVLYICFVAMHRIYQLGSPVVSLSVSCSSEKCANALKKDGIQITIVHDTLVCW